VKALVFRHSLAREAASAIGGRVDRRAVVSRFAPVRIEDVEEQPLPAEDWVRVETTFSGLCGSDVKQILLNGSRDNPLTALVSARARPRGASRLAERLAVPGEADISPSGKAAVAAVFGVGVQAFDRMLEQQRPERARVLPGQDLVLLLVTCRGEISARQPVQGRDALPVLRLPALQPLRHAMSVTGSGGMKSAMRSGPDA
jgi:hypothetical protein